MANKLGKVVVGMSGGVDSSVAAALLVEQGYEVIGAFMKNWSDTKGPTGECAWKEERRDAMRVAALLGIPFVTFDFEKEYKEEVVEYLFREYGAGRTPNPDIVCNSAIKFPLFWREAKKLGADYIATGHYAQVQPTANSEQPTVFKLQRAVDSNKDQTYFLCGITAEDLAHTLFPVGHLKKSEVRELARKFKLPVAEKKDSTGICFIGEVSMSEFLSQRISKKKGDIVTVDDKKVGEHNGVWFYTIGQRHGFGGGGGLPYFVVDRDLEKNELIVAPGAEHPRLYKKEIEVKDMHWISGKSPEMPFECEVRIRHRAPLAKAVLEFGIRNKELGADEAIIPNSRFIIRFGELQRAVTPGQMAVIYKDNTCLGGGVIV